MTHYVGNHDLQHVDRTPPRAKKDAAKKPESDKDLKLSQYQAETHDKQKSEQH